jgi:hypothetical protein
VLLADINYSHGPNKRARVHPRASTALEQLITIGRQAAKEAHGGLSLERSFDQEQLAAPSRRHAGRLRGRPVVIRSGGGELAYTSLVHPPYCPIAGSAYRRSSTKPSR